MPFANRNIAITLEWFSYCVLMNNYTMILFFKIILHEISGNIYVLRPHTTHHPHILWFFSLFPGRDGVWQLRDLHSHRRIQKTLPARPSLDPDCTNHSLRHFYGHPDRSLVSPVRLEMMEEMVRVDGIITNIKFDNITSNNLIMHSSLCRKIMVVNGSSSH